MCGRQRLASALVDHVKLLAEQALGQRIRAKTNLDTLAQLEYTPDRESTRERLRTAKEPSYLVGMPRTLPGSTDNVSKTVSPRSQLLSVR